MEEIYTEYDIEIEKMKEKNEIINYFLPKNPTPSIDEIFVIGTIKSLDKKIA